MKYKTWIISIIFLISLFSFYSFSHADQEGRSWSDLPSDHPLKHEKLLMKNNLLQQLFLFPQSSFDEKESVQIIQSIHKLPPSLLSKLVEKDVKLKLFNGKLTDNASAAHLKGVRPRGYASDATWDDVPGMGGSQIVYVKIGASDKGKGHSSVNLELHELAHSIDQIVYGGIQDNDKFLSIWRKEVRSLFPNQLYFINYPEEYFAEAFAMYYVNQEQNQCLKEYAPQTYSYIQSLN
jgi:Pro-Pro endopeptidase